MHPKSCLKIVNCKLKIGAIFFFLVLFSALAGIAHAQQTITNIGGYNLIVPLPGVGESAPTTLAEYVRFIYIWFMRVVALAAGVMFVAGGGRYVLSGGSPGRAQEARETISRALLGLVVVLASYLILNTINPSLVGIGRGEIPRVNLPLAKTYAPLGGAAPEGQCFSTDVGPSGLNGTDCSAIGNGWLPNPAGCSGSCSASEVCCACNAGSECALTEHTCAKIDPSGAAAQEFIQDPFICGPYLRADCNNACPQAFPVCVAGSCSDAAGETRVFEIQTPLPPRKGAAATSVGMGQPISIAVRAPSGVDTVEVKAYCPEGNACVAGSVVFADICAPSAGICSVLWNEGVIGSGSWRIEAVGKDVNGIVGTGMRDERLICGDCGPQVSFSVSAVEQKYDCQILTGGVFRADSVSGIARLRLDGSGSSGSGNTQIVNFSWNEEKNGILQPVYFGTQPAPVVEVSLAPGAHTIELRVFDEYGAYGTARQTITVAVSC